MMCLCFLLWLSFASYRGMEEFIEATDHRYHASRVLRTTLQLLYALGEIELVQREFVLFGDEAEVSRYYAARRDIRMAVDRLQSQSQLSEVHANDLDSLRVLIGERLSRVARRMRDKRLHPSDTPAKLVESESERAMHDRIRTLALKIQNAALKMLDDEHAVSMRNRQRFLYSFVFSDFLTLAVLAALVLWYQHSLRLTDRDARHQSEERFHQMAAMTGEWLWEQDPSGRFLYSNAAVKAVLGYEAEEIIGRSYFDLFARKARDHVLKLAYGDRTKRPFSRLINHYQHKDGREVITESTGIPVFNKFGHIVKWRGVDVDITARILNEEKVRKRDENLRTTLEYAPIPIITTDLDGRLLSFNSAFCRWFGYQAEQLHGKMLWDLIYVEDIPAVREHFRVATLGQEQPVEIHKRFHRRDGLSPISVRFALARDADEKPHHVILTLSACPEVSHKTRASLA